MVWHDYTTSQRCLQEAATLLAANDCLCCSWLRDRQHSSTPHDNRYIGDNHNPFDDHHHAVNSKSDR